MKKLLIWMTLILIVIASCGKKQELVVLEKGSPAYNLGKDLSQTLPFLDPDSNLVLVKTNTFQISTGEVLQMAFSTYGNRTESLKSFEANRLQQFILQMTENLTQQKLLLSKASELNIEASPSEIDSALNALYTRSGGEETLMNNLEQNDVDFEYAKNNLIKNIIVRKYIKEVENEKNRLTEEQIQTAYQAYLQDTTVTVRHILLTTQGKTETEKSAIRNKMKDILSRARKGEDFAELAREFTEDPGSRENGGLYENFSRGTMVPPFEEASFTTPVGEISDIVETQFGYHIIKVIERGKNDKPLEEVRSELQAKFNMQQRQSMITDHIQQLKDEAHLEMMNL